MWTSRLVCLSFLSGFQLDLPALAEEFACAFGAAGDHDVDLAELGPGIYAVDVGDTRLGLAYGDAALGGAATTTLLVSIGPRVADPRPCQFLSNAKDFLRSVAQLLHQKAPVTVTMQTRADGIFCPALCAKARELEAMLVRTPQRSIVPRRVEAQSPSSASRLTRLSQSVYRPRQDGTAIKLYFDGEACRAVPTRLDGREPGAFAARAVFRTAIPVDSEPPVPVIRQVARATALASAAIGCAQSAAANVLADIPVLPF